MVNQARQRLLVDTDAYCKLEVAGLFIDAITLLDVRIGECGRLAALTRMLRRGRLRENLGEVASDALIPIAEKMPVAVQPSDQWLSPLIAVTSIDPGEAQLLAASAEYEILLLTGDKRGIQGVKDVPGFADALEGRVIVLEAILAELCGQIGLQALSSRIQPLLKIDNAFRLSFSASNSSPLVGLMSFYRGLEADVRPLNLWKPSVQGGV